jgi:hypothetical protein
VSAVADADKTNFPAVCDNSTSANGANDVLFLKTSGHIPFDRYVKLA